jgi:hypothetical protein
MPRPSKRSIKSSAARLPKGVGGLAVFLDALGTMTPTVRSPFARRDAKASQSEQNIRALYRRQAADARAKAKAQAPTLRSRFQAVARLVRPMWIINRVAENAFVGGWMKAAAADTRAVESWEIISDPDSLAEQQRDAARMEERVATMAQRRRVRRLYALIDAEQALPKVPAQDRRVAASAAQETALAAFDRAARGGR